jgi:hypothetical protein
MNKWHKQKYCCDCNKPLGKNAQYSGTERCLKCNGLHLSETYRGKDTSNYRHGETLINHYCKCGKEIDYRSKKCPSCSNIYLHKIGILNSKGKNNGNYIDGRSYEDYPVEFTEQLKEEIRERDNYTCQGEDCSMTYEEHLIIYGRNLHVHHIDYNKENCDKINLITLCQQCNLRANANRDYWIEFYQNKSRIFIGD